MGTQPIIKIEIWYRKTKIGMIRVWHNGNLPHGTNTIGMKSNETTSHLIFDKSDSIRLRTEECKWTSSFMKKEGTTPNEWKTKESHCAYHSKVCTQVISTTYLFEILISHYFHTMLLEKGFSNKGTLKMQEGQNFSSLFCWWLDDF